MGADGYSRQRSGIVPLTLPLPDGRVRAAVLTLWATILAERLGHPACNALIPGRAIAAAAAREQPRSIGREEWSADRDGDMPGPAQERVTTPVLLLGRPTRVMANERGELRASEVNVPADLVGGEHHLVKASREHCKPVGQRWGSLRAI